MTTLTPVICSKARMLRPSRPMIRPFMSSLGRCTTATDATRWSARRPAAGSTVASTRGPWSRPRPGRRCSISRASDRRRAAGRRARRSASSSWRPRRSVRRARARGDVRSRRELGASSSSEASASASCWDRSSRCALLGVEPLLALGEPLLAALDVVALLLEVLVEGLLGTPARGRARRDEQQDDARRTTRAARPTAMDRRGPGPRAAADPAQPGRRSCGRPSTSHRAGSLVPGSPWSSSWSTAGARSRGGRGRRAVKERSGPSADLVRSSRSSSAPVELLAHHPEGHARRGSPCGPASRSAAGPRSAWSSARTVRSLRRTSSRAASTSSSGSTSSSASARPRRRRPCAAAPGERPPGQPPAGLPGLRPSPRANAASSTSPTSSNRSSSRSATSSGTCLLGQLGGQLGPAAGLAGQLVEQDLARHRLVVGLGRAPRCRRAAASAPVSTRLERGHARPPTVVRRAVAVDRGPAQNSIVDRLGRAAASAVDLRARSPSFSRILFSSSLARSGLSRRKLRAFSLPWPSWSPS